MKNQEKKHILAQSECGNALIIILIAVALLFALGVAVMSNDSGSKTTFSKGEAKIAASEILKYARSVEDAVKKLQLVNGCSELEISFDNNAVAGYTNGSAPLDNSCHIFEQNGTGLAWGDDWTYTGANFVTDIPTTANTTPDLIALYTNSDLSENVCEEINKQLGIATTSPQIDDNTTTQYQGTFSGSPNGIGEDWTDLASEKSGCLENSPAGTYSFYHVLIAR